MRAVRRFGPRPGSFTVTSCACGELGNPDLHRPAEGGLLEIDLEIVSKIAPTLSCRALAAAAAEDITEGPIEKITKDVFKITHARKATRPGAGTAKSTGR